MTELVGDHDMMEDWSLQAIVRGSSGEYGKIVDMEMEGRDSFLGCDRFDLTSSFIFEGSTGSSDELEDLYKPFYPPTTTTNSLPDQIQTNILEFQEQNVSQDKPAASHDQSDQSSSVTSPVASATAVYTPKYKKRKNQQKRVVIQVSAEGLSSDMWAWRKYGQKPIKGSPYPRSYYRCSSSKGCLARKQVEQSCTDPGMFIITYTAEHSHSQPTRRNSLAGTVRQKFSSSSSSSSPNPNPKQEKITSTSISTSTSTSTSNNNSTKILLDINSINVVPPPPRIKQEDKAKAKACTSEELMMSDFVFNEEFFSGLEEFDEFVNVSHGSSHQYPVRSSCTWI